MFATDFSCKSINTVESMLVLDIDPSTASKDDSIQVRLTYLLSTGTFVHGNTWYGLNNGHRYSTGIDDICIWCRLGVIIFSNNKIFEKGNKN